MAKLDDLKAAWQAESGISLERFERIGEDVQYSTRRLQSVIFRRDMLETFASVIVIAAFASWMMVADSWLERLGCAVIVGAGVLIPLVLWWARRRPLKEVSAANFREFVDVEVEYLRRQSRIIRNVAWWYLLPIYVGMVLIVVGIIGAKPHMAEMIGGAIMLLGISSLCWYLWRLNQCARTNNLDPMLEYYQRIQSALEKGEGFDELDAGPPSAFLKPGFRRTITKRARWIGILVAAIGFIAIVAFGLAIVARFDPRTGWFVVSTSPVVALLLFVCSGGWGAVDRTNSVES